MAILKNIKASDADQLTRLINGLVLGRQNLVLGRDRSPNPTAAPNNLYKHPLNGLTLDFTTPAGTVTFVGDLDFKQIVDQINTQLGTDVANLWKAEQVGNGAMNLALWNDTTPVVLADTGTANEYLGFSTTPADPSLTQTPIDPTKIIEIVVEVQSRKYVCFYTT